jgi:hypothetical protein
VVLGPIWLPPSEAVADAFFDAFIKARRSRGLDEPIADVGTVRVELGASTVDARELRVGAFVARLALVPVCSGHMTIAAATVASEGSFAEVAAERWLKALRIREASPACDALKSLRDPSDGRARQ